MGAAVRGFDWSRTCLGAISAWPASLKTLVGLMLDSRQPKFMAWSPQRVWLYNDAFIPILGRKHPGALGQPSQEVWAEAWTDPNYSAYLPAGRRIEAYGHAQGAIDPRKQGVDSVAGSGAAGRRS
jgi:hypothetical protein